MNKIQKLLLSVALAFSGGLLAEVAVIVHPSNADSISEADIVRIFLGKSKSFPGGAAAVPVNQAEGSAVTEEFNQKVIKKSGSQLKAYWSKLVFTGKGTPPKEVANDAEVIDLVANNPNMIGYIDASQVNGGVKVVAKF
jgi:ABC-type phosphate transport system substrate-binding protein